jgi:hypothetical protein
MVSVHGSSRPPVDELPGVLPTPDITWRGEGIVVAVPSLQVYSTGVMLTIICRMNSPQPQTLEHASAMGDRVSQLKVSGTPVQQFGGNHDGWGFAYSAWVPLPPDAITSDVPLTFELGWPEVEHAVHQVYGIKDAASKVVRVWSG